MRDVVVDEPDPPLRLTQVNVGTLRCPSWQTWDVVTPRAKLRAKYTRGTSALFGHYVHQFRHAEPDRITQVDVVAADRLMGANISARNDRWDSVMSDDVGRRVAKTLAKIPVGASIDDASFDHVVASTIECLTRLEGVKLAIATKLLAIKRPFLIPMMDSVVQLCFASSDPVVILREFRRLLSDEDTAAHVGRLGRAVEALVGFAPSPVRILDELIWFDWNLHEVGRGSWRVVGFDDWGYSEREEARGVHLLDA